MTTELLSKPFILFCSKVKTKPRREATWRDFTSVQAKYSLGRPFSSTFTLASAARRPAEQRLFCASVYCVPYGLQDHPLTVTQSL